MINRMRWAEAVKEWNSIQFFKEDLYGIPKKGGQYYDDVKEIMDSSKYKKDVEKMMGKSTAPPKIDTQVSSEAKVEEKKEPLMETKPKVKPILLAKQAKVEEKKFIFLVAKGKFDEEGNIELFVVPRKGTKEYNPSTGNRAAMMESGRLKNWIKNGKPQQEIIDWLNKNTKQEMPSDKPRQVSKSRGIIETIPVEDLAQYHNMKAKRNKVGIEFFEKKYPGLKEYESQRLGLIKRNYGRR